MSKPIPVKLDAALLDRIQKLAERVGEPQSTIMRFAMRVGLEGLEKVFETAAPSIEKLILNERHHQGPTEYKLQGIAAQVMHEGVSSSPEPAETPQHRPASPGKSLPGEPVQQSSGPTRRAGKTRKPRRNSDG